MAFGATEEKVIEAKETTVNFVQIKATDFPPTDSTPNALIATNTVILKRIASSSKTTKPALDISHKTLVCNPSIHPTEITETIIPLNPVPTVNTIHS